MPPARARYERLGRSPHGSSPPTGCRSHPPPERSVVTLGTAVVVFQQLEVVADLDQLGLVSDKGGVWPSRSVHDSAVVVSLHVCAGGIAQPRVRHVSVSSEPNEMRPQLG